VRLVRKYLSSFNSQELPLVSICIPAYNAEATIAETLDTVLAQNYPLLDVVVSDNQSTDNTKAIVQEYANRGVRYVYHSEGRPDWAAGMPSYIGAYINSNFVLSQAYGDYLCLFHSDDLYEPSIVRKQVLVMQANPQVGAVFTHARRIDEDSQPIRMGITKLPKELKGQSLFTFPNLLNAVLSYGNFLQAPSVMLRRSVMNDVGGFNERQFLTSADLEMWLQIAREGYQIAVIDEPLLKYRISQKQFGQQYNKLRVTLSDFFRVMDYFLGQTIVQELARPKSIALYELHRFIDYKICSMNLLAKGEELEARSQLSNSLHWQHFITALYRPRLLKQLLEGMILLLSTYMRVGPLVGRQMHSMYKRKIQRLRKPEKLQRKLTGKFKATHV